MEVDKFSRSWKDYPMNHPDHFNDLTSEEQEILTRWIKGNIFPRKTVLTSSTSYGLKRRFKEFYVTNGQFKGAMLSCGYHPHDLMEMNWSYGISKKSPVFSIRQFS